MKCYRVLSRVYKTARVKYVQVMTGKKKRRIALALIGNSQRGTTELTFAHYQQGRIDYKGYISYTGYMLKSYNFRHL